MSRILVVDDESSIRESLAGLLADEGHEIVSAADGAQALALLRAADTDALPDVVLLDIAMPGRDGLEVLADLSQAWPEIPVVMMSGHGTIETVVRSTRLGAFDFVEKPLPVDKLLLTIEHALERSRLQSENRRLRVDALRAHRILGTSEPIRRLAEQIALAAPTQGWVLITGESGTGKELVARQIHLQSRRASKPFVAVNCAAIPEELIESGCSGTKGSFTGVVRRRRTLRLAHGGTIFRRDRRHEPQDTSEDSAHPAENEFERVGGSETIEVDVRVIAATNKSLRRDRGGRFREDLYYRLAVIPFHVRRCASAAGHSDPRRCVRARVQCRIGVRRRRSRRAMAALRGHAGRGTSAVAQRGRAVGADDAGTAHRHR